MDPELVTINQAKALCGVTRRAIYNWIEEGKIQFIRTAGGSIRILTESLFQPGNVPVPKALRGRRPA